MNSLSFIKSGLMVALALAVPIDRVSLHAQTPATPSHPAEPTRRAVYQLKNQFGITVTVNVPTGTYRVDLPGRELAGSSMRSRQTQPWLGQGIVSVLANRMWYRSTPPAQHPEQEAGKPTGEGNGTSPSPGVLILTDVQTGSSSDRFGPYNFIDIHWLVPEVHVPLITAFHLYQDHPYLIFVQKFPLGFEHYASGNWTLPSVLFPQFIGSYYGDPQNLTLWTSGGMWNHRLGSGDAFTLQGTVEPLVLADPADQAVVLSPFDHYLVATQQSRPLGPPDTVSIGSIECGIEGLVQDIPAGFEHSTILVAGQGIHDTLYRWGGALLERAGKSVPSKYQDDTLKYLAYVDDAGAYYYGHHFQETGYKTYADIILAIEKEAKEHYLHIGSYHILDDPQQRDRSDGLFEPRTDLFSQGLAAFHKELGKPLELYMMWIKPNGPYRQKYKYYASDPGSIPFGMGDVFYSKEYWHDTADKLASWGTILLQHDFLSDYEGNRAMMSSVDKMDTYFRNMAEALRAKGIDMQYCMAMPRNILQSTENPVMVSLQATEDHHVPTTEPDSQTENPDGYDPYFWKHVIFTSGMYGALGIWPSRDNIQTVADPNAFEDVLLANLLGGSIQLGHRLGEVNYDLLRKTYREGDGLLLKPDMPIHPIDRCYREGCAVGFTQSSLGGDTWAYVLSLPSAGYTSAFTPSDAEENDGQYAVYNWDTHVIQIRGSEAPVDLVREAKHEYFVVAPVLKNGMAVIGDTSKFVTMADKRIASVEATGTSITVSVIGSGKSSPIISGYSLNRPEAVEVGGAKLEAQSSVDRLSRAKSGWSWDYQTKMWSIKLDFSSATGMEKQAFVISSAGPAAQ